ncbi:30S ribosomal protein S15 [Pyrofollis japonicus]|jgi:small subunit ribosomal protein S15|uniref:30S ribosomal protein S15 n=1 Tax=Pyrofollis japonicus TaxID=3060460 RepID=UPI00295A6350|nr:30S ribosomal protein S15 [Pyrofollis japonicus]BEP18631.1 30S ribosomal protein S15 [Pyrofollis japonicus]
MAGKRRKKGRSHSTRPASPAIPKWVQYDPEEIEEIIVDLAKKGYPPSMIGIILRDQFGIPLVKPILGKTITEVLEEHGIKMVVPEDLFRLIQKAVNLRRHLEEHPKDTHAKKGLLDLEAKIRRIVKYYKREGKLPPDWEYDPQRAKLLVAGGLYIEAAK